MNSPVNRSRIIRSAVLIGLLAAVVAAAWLWYRAALLRGPLEGMTRHDFGDVMLREVPATVEHRFVLRNRTSEVIELETAKPDCACVNLEVQPQSIGPGESLELPLTMKVHPGTTKVRILLALAGAGNQSLWVQATGKLPSKLAVMPQQVWFEDSGGGEGRASFAVAAYMFDTNKPPARPAVRGPAQLAADVGEWTLRHRPRTGAAPTEWQSVVVLRAAEPRTLAGSVVEVSVEGLDSVAVQVIAPEQAPMGQRPRPVIDVPVQGAPGSPR